MTMSHPFIRLLRIRNLRILWTGLSLSAIGDEIYRIGVIWMAIDIAGADASFLPTAQSIALLLTSIFAGGFAERFSPRAMMVAADLLRALLSVLPVLLWLTVGLNLEFLIASAIAL